MGSMILPRRHGALGMSGSFGQSLENVLNHGHLCTPPHQAECPVPHDSVFSLTIYLIKDQPKELCGLGIY